MELPNLKNEALEQLNKLNGTVIGMIQIVANSEGHVSVCAGGIPDVLVQTLSKVMRDNPQFRDIIESAWTESIDTSEFLK